MSTFTLSLRPTAVLVYKKRHECRHLRDIAENKPFSGSGSVCAPTPVPTVLGGLAQPSVGPLAYAGCRG